MQRIPHTVNEALPNTAARRTSRRRLIAAGASAVVVSGTVAATAPSPAAAQDHPLAGTWLGTLVREDHPADFPVVRFVYTFEPDGSLSAAGPPSVVEAGDRVTINAGHGAWRSLPGRQYAFHYTSGAYTETGVFRFAIVVTAKVTLNPTQDNWSGTYQRADLDADGMTLRTVHGTVSATLVPISD